MGGLTQVPPLPTVSHQEIHGITDGAKPARNLKTSDRHWKQQYYEKMSCGTCVPPPPPPPPPGRGGNRVRQGDTNVVAVKLNQLKAPSNMHAGDPTFCTSCSAILSKVSKPVVEEGEKVWTCEFCTQRNIVDIEEEEVPTEEDVTFMLEPAPSTVASGPSGLDESLVIFCVDTSGSMCVTTEVPGHVQLRGSHSTRSVRHLHGDRTDQYLPSQRRDVTYVSRLQSVQAAIDHQLQEMEKNFPNKRVAIITFCNEVSVVGDGKSDPVSIAGDKLSNRDTLESIATEQAIPESIKSTRQKLGEKLFELEECGPTALGPALVVATKMAARMRGSKVILCTDGLANIGIGKLDQFKNEEEEDQSLKFYDDISQSAVDAGVSISVITIKGTDCKLVDLGKLADKTGGQVNIVDPLKLTQQFSTILANQIIATNVEATVILHKRLFFFYEDTEESKVVKNIGNATEDTEISFEYGVRVEQKENATVIPEETQKPGCSKDSPRTVGGATGTEMDVGGATGDNSSVGEASTSQQKDRAEGIEKLPFQLQIKYTDTEGAKALRVITKMRPVTRNRTEAERKAKLGVLAQHAARVTSEFCLAGQYTLSRERALMNQRVAWRHTREAAEEGGGGNVADKKDYKKKFGKIKKMENYLNIRQKSERASTGGRTLSDDEDDAKVGIHCYSASREMPKSKFSWLKKKKRSATTSDSGAAMAYKGKGKSFFDDDSDDEWDD